MWFSKINTWLNLRREFHIKQTTQHAYTGFLKSKTTLEFISHLDISPIKPHDLASVSVSLAYGRVTEFNAKLSKYVKQIRHDDYLSEYPTVMEENNLDGFFVDKSNIPISLSRVCTTLQITFGELITALAEKQNTPKHDYYQRFLLKPSIDGLQITEALATLVERQCDMSFWTYCMTLLKESRKPLV